jgi:diguanylate cyclase (GGDEF)-like protein/PAS domain S-box-containing protein
VPTEHPSTFEGSDDRARAYAHAILDAALDAVVTIDQRGVVLEFNRAAERTFGFRREHVLGQELASLIVPPKYRERHRRALARWTEEGPGPGAGNMLGRRAELEAMRADGSVFPVELAVSRVDVPGPPLFTACIRDVSEHKDAEDRLREAEFRFRTLVEQLPLISYVDASDSAVSKPTYLSPQVEAVLGYSPAEWLATPDLYERSIHPEDCGRVLAEKQAAYEAGLPLRSEYRMLAADGRVVWVEDQSVPIETPDGATFRQGFAVDVTERKQAEEALRRAENRYRTLVESLPLAVYIDRLDELSSNVYTSPQVQPMLGYSSDEWTSNPGLFLEVLHPDDRERVLAAHEATRTTSEPLDVEYRMIARDGSVVWVQDESRVISDPDGGDEPVLQGYLLDITDRKDAEEKLRHQAFHDALTELPNRALFTDRVEHALVVRTERGGDVAVLFVDLDDFKAVNDSYGHPAGDELLRAVGRRLRDSVEPRHTVARIGGDEFAILIEGGSGIAGAVSAAERVLARFHEPFDVDGREFFVTPSIGIAVGDDADELLRSANVAMYRAKASGGAQYVVYAPRMDEGVAGRLELVGDLRRADVDREFVLHYQPNVDLATGTVVGFEALLRWQHPRRGLLMPAEFIASAEATGRIVEIGRWVLGEASRQVATWRERLGSDALSVSVNVSPRQVRRPGLIEDVQAALAASGLDPSALTLEITESVLAGPRDDLIGILQEVTEIGVDLALDDFGTGYSSLSLLQDLPVDTLKMDRAFVGAMGTAGERVALVRAIVELAHALGLQVVGEGIETELHVSTLMRFGCRVGQGFYFARPLTVAEIDALIVDGRLPRLPGGGAERAVAA